MGVSSILSSLDICDPGWAMKLLFSVVEGFGFANREVSTSDGDRLKLFFMENWLVFPHSSPMMLLSSLDASFASPDELFGKVTSGEITSESPRTITSFKSLCLRGTLILLFFRSFL